MEFKSLQDLIRYVDSAFALKFYSGAAVLRKGVLKVLASVFGGALYMISLLCKRIWKNRFLTTCEVSALDGFGVEFELPHKAPTYAKGYAEVTLATGSSSATVQAGTYLVDPLTRLEYRTLLAASISATNKKIRVVAAAAGGDYNADVGTVLEFRDATPAGLEATCTVSGELGLFGGYSTVVSIDGVDQVWGETAEEYRQRLLYRERNAPMGGADSDYKIWAERFDFVSKAFVVAQQPNVNSVCVVLANFHTQQIVVDPSDVAKVSNYINTPARRPATADVHVFSATVANFAISATVAPYNDEVFQSVNAAFEALLKNFGPGSTPLLFQQAEDYVRNNSIAETFTINSVTKNGNVVTMFSLDFYPGTQVGEVAKIATTFTSGE